MEKINRHNYAIFFIDYFDNELNEHTTKDLFAFLELHPDLKEEFESFENISLPGLSLELNNKPKLKKHIDESNIEHYIIADLEGELDENDQVEFTNFISENALYASTLARYKKTILPVEVISFDNKKDLKQKNKVIVFWPYATAIAAAVLLLFILNTTNTPQQYKIQALIEVENTSDTLNKTFFIELKNTSEIANKQIAKKQSKKLKNNSKAEYKKEASPIFKSIDSLKKVPKIEEQTLPLEKEIAINIKGEEIENNIALAENKTILQESNLIQKEVIPTLKQTIHNTIKSKVFNDDQNNNQPIDKEYLITSAAEKSDKILFEQTEERQRKKTRLKIGKFEFYRDKKV